MVKFDLDHLEAVATRSAAEPGWYDLESLVDYGACEVIRAASVAGDAEFVAGDAEFIATFDPPTVLALIERLRAAEAIADAARAAVRAEHAERAAGVDDSCPADIWERLYEAARAADDALRAAVNAEVVA